MVAEPLSRVVRPPEINDLVKITLGGVEDPDGTRFASEVPTRVEDLTRDRRTGKPLEYRLAAPWFSGDLEEPSEGTECALQWVTPRGLCRLPCAFEAVEGTAGVRVWRVRVTGPVVRDERRRFVRVPWAVPVELQVCHDLDRVSGAARRRAEESGVRPLLTGLPESVEGQAINFSEGGLRCLSPEPALPEGLPLVVRFTLDDHHFEAAAFVVWSVSQHGSPAVVASPRSEPAGKEGSGKERAGKEPAG
ncbi:MAG: hypothetical protein QG622_27, partial [Actinomycetota bacterium]|nr:hypothetical protein [Actinomycetota bacterium]